VSSITGTLRPARRARAGRIPCPPV